MGLGFKRLLTAWNRKWLDELNRMLEELFDMKFIHDNQISEIELKKNVVPVLFAESANVPNYDTATQTLDFKSATGNQPVLFYGEQKYIIPIGTTVSASSITTTTAVKLLFDVTTNLFSFVAWSTVPAENQLQIGTMRRDGSKISMPFNVTVDGFLIFPAKTTIEKDVDKRIDSISFNDLALKEYSDMFNTSTIKQGIINTTDGTVSEGIANRVFTQTSYKMSKGTTISVKNSNYSFAVYYYSEDVSSYDAATSKGKFVKSYGQFFSSYVVTQDTYMRFMIKKNDNSNFTPSSVVLKNIIGASYNGFSELQANVIPASKIRGLSNTSYCHISFDDVKYVWIDLVNNKATYKSIFDNPFLKVLQSFHTQYGACFSLYVFLAEFLTMDATFINDFRDSSNWLKIGLHLNETYDNYEKTTYQQAYNDYQSFVQKAFQVTGTYSSIDRIPRLQNFAFNEVSLKGMMDANCGVLGMLTADDSRSVTYLSTNQETYLRSHDKLLDSEMGSMFLSTDLRLENVSGNVSSTLKTNISNYLLNDMYDSVILFSHEQIYYTGTTVNSKVSDIESACSFAYDYQIPFDYPQNRNNLQKKVASDLVKDKQNIVLGFEQGHIDGNGYEAASDLRIRTKHLYFHAGKTISITVPSAYSLRILMFDNQEKIGVSVTDFGSGVFSEVVSGKKYYRFVLSKSDGTKITPSNMVDVDFYIIG